MFRKLHRAVDPHMNMCIVFYGVCLVDIFWWLWR